MKYVNCHPVYLRDTLASRRPAGWSAEPTVHGQEPFIVRMMSILLPDGQFELVVSDRRESFTGIFLCEENKFNFALLDALIVDRLDRVYLLATYLGNSILRLRIDPLPDQDMFIW